MARPRGSWDDLSYSGKYRYRRGGRSEEEARHLYESGAPAPESKSKSERKQEVQAALVHKDEFTVVAPDQRWADEINEAVGRLGVTIADVVSAIIDLGSILRTAKANLPHGSFTPMVESKTRFKSVRSAQLYMQVSEWAETVLQKRALVSHLPPSVSSLAVLTQLDQATLEQAIRDEAVTPELDRDGARRVVGNYAPRELEGVEVSQLPAPDTIVPDFEHHEEQDDDQDADGDDTDDEDDDQDADDDQADDDRIELYVDTTPPEVRLARNGLTDAIARIWALPADQRPVVIEPFSYKLRELLALVNERRP